MLTNLIFVYLLSLVLCKSVPDKENLTIEKIKEPLKELQTVNSIVNSAIIEHIQDLLKELLESSLSGKNRNQESTFWCSRVGKEICKEECKDEDTLGNIMCITNNFILDIAYCSTGYTDCTDDEREGCSNWSYPSQNWTTLCPNYCNGSRQSPINIETSSFLLGPEGFVNEELIYINYTPSISTVNLKNNGHSATISWDTSVNTPSISGGGLGADYTLANIHFHWGCVNTRGSEHTINGDSAAMEMHLVHYKTSYGDIGEAIKHSDGLAVLAVGIIVGVENQALKPITDNLSQITQAGTEIDIAFNVAIEDFLPSNKQFLRYLGSLTTPACNEVVTWTLLGLPTELSQAQIEAFRSMKDHHNVSICDNNREVQPLNGRHVSMYTGNSPSF